MDKSIKRTYQLMLSLTLLFILIATCLFVGFTTKRVDADTSGGPTIVVESKTVHRGQAVEIDVNLTSNPTGFTALCLKLNYNTEALKLLSYSEGEGLKEQVGNETKKLDLFVTEKESC